MGLADTVTKAYMKENTVFADAFNYLIYGGKAVVDPAQLQELDTTEIALPFGAQDENGNQPDDAVQKYRDVLKSAVIKQDGEAAYILLGIENQTDIHYAMPVRNIIYDALQYGKQVADIAAKHRTGGSKGHSRGEYLSEFYKDDKITPVITLVLHFGANEWDGPLSLHEMMAVKNESLLNFVQDYQIHLIDPAKLSKEDLERFSTSLREVIGYIKYSKDKKRLTEFLTDNPRMLMEANAARVIKAVTNTPLDIPEDAEVIDVCKAVEDMYYLCVFSMIVPFQMVMFTLAKTADTLKLNNPYNICIIYLGFGAGLAVFMFTGFVKSMPIAIEEAAMIDGCNPIQIFFKVVCPILKPTMISTAILETMWVWNDYLLPTLVLDIKTYRTIPMAIQYFRGSYGKVEMAPMMACIMITVLPVIVLYLICQKYIIDGVVAGAVKG